MYFAHISATATTFHCSATVAPRVLQHIHPIRDLPETKAMGDAIFSLVSTPKFTNLSEQFVKSFAICKVSVMGGQG